MYSYSIFSNKGMLLQNASKNSPKKHKTGKQETICMTA